MKQTKKHNLQSLNVPLLKSQNTEKHVAIMNSDAGKRGLKHDAGE